VNFNKGANPPREQWKLPPTKTAEESRQAFQIFEQYVQFIKRFPEVQFITASEAANIYKDKARDREFTEKDIVDIARSVSENLTFQERGDITLSAAEVLAILDLSFSARLNSTTPRDDSVAVTKRSLNEESIGILGPTERITLMSRPITTDWSQFCRTSADVADYLHKQGRIPSTVWLGSAPVPPEAYLQALAKITIDLADHKPAPQKIEIRPAKLAVAQYVADDGANLWGWVIFPDGFRAPGMMALARQQSWTLKPALIDHSRN